jgi:hypothetical protein
VRWRVLLVVDRGVVLAAEVAGQVGITPARWRGRGCSASCRPGPPQPTSASAACFALRPIGETGDLETA